MKPFSSEPAEPASLVVEDLRIELARSSTYVVADVSFVVEPGEVLGLVGESGSGKTTVSLALLGHVRRGLKVASGRVSVAGNYMLALSGKELRAARGRLIAYVPQDPASALNPAMSVGAQLAEVLVRDAEMDEKARKARIEEVLGEVGLPGRRDLLRRYPAQLSGGQQQRMVLAMAFCCRPKVIVLDEPTTGLDVSTQKQVLDTISGLCRQRGTAAVYVSHDLAVVRGLADDVAVMYSGKVVEYGRSTDVFANPLHQYTRGLLNAVPSVKERRALTGIDGSPPRPQSRPEGCSFRPRCRAADETCLSVPQASIVRGNRMIRCFHPVAEGPASVAVSLGREPAGTARSKLLLDVTNLSADYGDTRVLSEVSLGVELGRCTAIVGESGSGKTTTARCIAGIHRDWQGEILFDGRPLERTARERTAEVRRQVQYIFQSPYASLNPRKSIKQIIGEAAHDYLGLGGKELADRVTAVLGEVSLPEGLLGRYPDELSGGERQRVAIARALVVDPVLLICDEISSALDVSIQATVIELLRRLGQQRNLAMLFITHNLALVRSIADTCVVLQDGRVVESGPVGAVLDSPQDPYTMRLMTDAGQVSTPAREVVP